MKKLKIIIPFLLVLFVIASGCSTKDMEPITLSYEVSDIGQVRGVVNINPNQYDYVFISLYPKFEGLDFYKSEKLAVYNEVITSSWMGYNEESLVNGTYELKLEILSDNDPIVITKEVTVTNGTELLSVTDKFAKDKEVISLIYNDLLSAYDLYEKNGDIESWDMFIMDWNHNAIETHEKIIPTKKGYEVAYTFVSTLYLEMDSITRGEEGDVDSIKSVIERLLDDESVLDVFESLADIISERS